MATLTTRGGARIRGSRCLQSRRWNAAKERGGTLAKAIPKEQPSRAILIGDFCRRGTCAEPRKLKTHGWWESNWDLLVKAAALLTAPPSCLITTVTLPIRAPPAMWDCVPDPWHAAAPGNACALAARDFTLARSGRLLGDRSCGGDRHDELALATVFSVLLATLVLPALVLNLGVAAVNLCSGRRVLAAIRGRGASTPSPPPSPASAAGRRTSAVDVYATSAALANALQLSVVLARLAGLTHDDASDDADPAHAVGPRRAYACTVAYALFHVSALAAAYSVTLLAFDAYLEAALPAGSRPPFVDAHSAPHVCAFLWGGSCLAAFPAALQIGCSEGGHLDCVALGVRELVDVSIVVTGFAVPAAGCCVSCWCSVRLLSAGGSAGDGGAEERGARERALRAALVAATAHFSLWAPFHASVAAGVFAAVRRRPSFRLVKALAQMAACAASCAGPCVYARAMRRGLGGRARRVAAALAVRCGRRRYARHSALPLAEIV